MYRVLSSALFAALGCLVWWVSDRWSGTRPGGAHWFWIATPALAFFLAAIIALFAGRDAPQHLHCSLAAALVGLVVTFIPGAWLELEIRNYRGGGANIGLAFLWILLPLYAPIAMLGGYHLARYAWFSKS